jgi:hypothetical protein
VTFEIAFRAMALFAAVLVLAPGLPALALQAPPPPPPGVPPPPPPAVASEAAPLAPQQLDDMVAPIALYPDPLWEKDLGPRTTAIASAIRRYNPDQTWKPSPHGAAEVPRAPAPRP